MDLEKLEVASLMGEVFFLPRKPGLKPIIVKLKAGRSPDEAIVPSSQATGVLEAPRRLLEAKGFGQREIMAIPP